MLRPLSPDWLACLSLLTGCLFTAIQHAAPIPASEVRKLSATPGEVVSGTLSAEGNQVFLIEIPESQLVRLQVDQIEMDALITVDTPEGKELTWDMRWGGVFSETVSLVAKTPGTYRIEVRSLEKLARKSRFELKVDERRQPNPSDEGRMLAELASTEVKRLISQNNPQAQREALGKAQEAMALWKAIGDLENSAYTLVTVGDLYYDQGENQKATQSFEEALAMWRNLSVRPGEALALVGLGQVSHGNGDAEKSLKYFGQALSIWRETGNRRLEARTLAAIGADHWQMNDYAKALETLSSSLALAEEVDDPRARATSHQNLGIVNSSLGDFQKAVEHYQQSIALREGLKDERALAVSLSSLGVAYKSLGENQKALEVLRRSLPLRRAFGYKRGEAYTLSNIGGVYAVLGDYERAVVYLKQSLALAQAVEDRPLEASNLIELGDMHRALGAPKNALEVYSQALAVDFKGQIQRLRSNALEGKGHAYWALGKEKDALDCHSQSLSLRRSIGYRVGVAANLRAIGDIYSGRNETEKALEHYREALSLVRAAGARRSEAVTLAAMARTESRRGHLEDARRFVEAALNLVEDLRIRLGLALRTPYLASNQDLYRLYIDVLLGLHQADPSRGYDISAFEASERARARTVLDYLTETQAEIREGADPEMLRQERLLQHRLNSKEELRIRLLARKHTEQEATTARQDVEMALAEYQELQSRIRLQNPHYAALTQPRPLSFKEIQEQVLDDDTLLLEYSLGRENSQVWAVTSTSLRHFALPRRSEIEEAARRFCDLLGKSHRRILQMPTELGAAELGTLLLGPLAAELNRRRLIFVAEGILQHIPFGALLKPAAKRSVGKLGPLLIEEHEIAYAPSASSIALLRQELRGRPLAPKLLAIFSDPVFGAQDERVKLKRDRAGAGSAQRATPGSARTERSLQSPEEETESGLLQRLPYTGKEGEAIAALSPPSARLHAAGFSANRAAVLAPELGDYRMLHFATHGLISGSHPELSGIALSTVDESGAPQEGFVRAHEIFNLRLRADLAVLSACQTALGKEIRGEGLVGLARGFMYAGVPRIVASLWDVRDEATAELMERFYRGVLVDKLAPCSALRQAQISIRKQKRWEAPYYWAAFVLQGEWR